MASNLEDLLPALAQAVLDATRARWIRIWTVEDSEETLRERARAGLVPEEDADPGHSTGALANQARRALAWKEGDAIETPSADGATTDALYLAPLLASDQALGVLVAGLGKEPIDEEGRLFVDTVAQLAGMAVREARLADRVRLAEQRVRETQGLLLQAERMASVGEEVGRFVEEIRGPLHTIAESARRIAETEGAMERSGNLASLVFREVQRVESMLEEQAKRARLTRPRLEMVDLASLIRCCVDEIREELELRAVRLDELHEPALPAVLLDREKVSQVFQNILASALQPLDRGERLRVRTQRAGAHLVVEIASDGTALGGDLLERLFVPFATRRPGGSGLGLAIARQIVVDHGGEIDVRSDDVWTLAFTIRFPILDNRDRRRANDRRHKDRRQPA